MTALERRWVESEWFGVWEDGYWSREIDDDHWISIWRVGESFYGSLLIRPNPPVSGPFVHFLHEAKSDAEAMYRQWVYDEYGVVLP